MSCKRCQQKGFTLIEVTIVILIVGILAAAGIHFFSRSPEARMAACIADLDAMNSIVQQRAEQTFPNFPTWDEIDKSHWKDHYHYIPNNTDANKGHGNDLDLCDEENPGASAENRSCLNINYVIVCDHNHGQLAKYNFISDGSPPVVVPTQTILNGKPKKGESRDLLKRGNGDAFLKDLYYWQAKDPDLVKWIGR